MINPLLLASLLNMFPDNVCLYHRLLLVQRFSCITAIFTYDLFSRHFFFTFSIPLSLSPSLVLEHVTNSPSSHRCVHTHTYLLHTDTVTAHLLGSGCALMDYSSRIISMIIQSFPIFIIFMVFLFVIKHNYHNLYCSIPNYCYTIIF